MTTPILQPYKKIVIEGDQLFIMADLSIPKKALSTLLYKAADLMDAGELQEQQILNFLVDGLKPFLHGFSNDGLVDYYLRTYITNTASKGGLNLF